MSYRTTLSPPALPVSASEHVLIHTKLLTNPNVKSANVSIDDSVPITTAAITIAVITTTAITIAVITIVITTIAVTIGAIISMVISATAVLLASSDLHLTSIVLELSLIHI